MFWKIHLPPVIILINTSQYLDFQAIPTKFGEHIDEKQSMLASIKWLCKNEQIINALRNYAKIYKNWVWNGTIVKIK